MLHFLVSQDVDVKTRTIACTYFTWLKTLHASITIFWERNFAHLPACIGCNRDLSKTLSATQVAYALSRVMKVQHNINRKKFEKIGVLKFKKYINDIVRLNSERNN